MAPKRAAVNGPAKPVGPTTPLPAPAPSSGLPETLKFPLVVVLAFSFTTILYQIASIFISGLGSVSRKDPTLDQALGFYVWRIVELGVGWYLGYDDLDITSLTLLTRTPHYYLLSTFYLFPPLKSALYLTLDVLSTALPFTLLRRRIPQHSPSAKSKSPIPNATIVFDTGIWTLTLVTASAVYATTIGLSIRSWVPPFLVAHTEGIRTLELAHASQPIFLSLAFLPLGWAAETFLFSPSAAAVPTVRDAKAHAFNPDTATLWETLAWNVWGWKKGTKVLIQRSVVMAALVGLSTYVKVWGTVDGAEPAGALGWAALWAAASLIQGPLLGWIGQVGSETETV